MLALISIQHLLIKFKINPNVIVKLIDFQINAYFILFPTSLLKGDTRKRKREREVIYMLYNDKQAPISTNPRGICFISSILENYNSEC